MVSLGPNFSFSSNAQFLDSGIGASGNRDDDRQQLFDPVLISDSDRSFTPLKTIPAFSFHLLISTLISFVGVLLAFIWPDDKRCEAYFIMLYLRAAFWAITFIFDHYIKHHHEKLRLNGYHEFHRATSVHKGVPLYIVSLWNTTILAVQALIQQYYGPNFGEHCVLGFFSPIIYLNAFNILETVVLTFVSGCYIGRVKKFNKAAQPPDALRGSHLGSGSVGLAQPGGNLTELLEKQADLITYLKDHNLKLNQKLMQLNSEVRYFKSQATLQHLAD